MKKRALAMFCAAVLAVGLMAEPVFAADSLGESGSETVALNESGNETESKENIENTETAESIKESTEAAEQTDAQNSVESETDMQYETQVFSVARAIEKEERPQVVAEAVGAGGFKIEITGIEESADIKTVYVPVWKNSDQSDIYWYKAQKQSDGSYLVNANIENHKYHLGQYTIHVYIETQNGTMNYIARSSVVLNNISAGNFYEKTENEYSRKLILDGVEDQGIANKVYFAVWSAENGQDDIYWYEAAANGNTYSANVLFYNHRSTGVYNAHAYISGKDGQMHIVKTMVFQVDKLPKEKVEVGTVDSTQGRFDVRMYLNRAPSEIDTVYLAAWTTSNQSDILWYEANRQADGSYLVNVDVKNHQYHIGKYSLHGYVRDKSGRMILIGTTSCTLKLSSGNIMEALNDNGYSTRLTLSDVQTQGIANKVYFAVWSAKNGQDDIYWYEASGNGTTYSADVMFYNHKDVGTYNVHAYIAGRNGQMHLVKTGTFQVAELPKDEIEVVGLDNGKGQFNVKMYVNRPESSISTVYLAAWSEGDQSNIYWYEAKRQADGSYLVNGDLKNHQYKTGVYKLHGYVRDKQGRMLWVDSAECTLKFSIGAFSAVPSDKAYAKRLVLSDVHTQGVASKIYFAVWSQKDGQNDIYWYEASPEGANYVVDALLYNHKNLGMYNAHAYYQDKNGQMHIIKGMTFEFDADEMPKENIVISNVNEKNGTFDVNVYLVRSPESIKKVYVPVWTKSDQRDIFWYVADKQADGSYHVTVDATKHQWNSGRYNVHSYVQKPDGAMQFVKSGYADMQLGMKVVAETLDTRSVRVKLYGAGDNATKVQFPAWSIENDQDDLVWYNGVKNSDGSWSADVHTKNHKSTGAYICDVYLTENNNTSFVERAEFNIAEKWEGTWRWIDGYKRYIGSNGEVDNDVSRLVSGPYLIKVYKWSNYLIVFAKDEYGNYTVPVKAMITSCGNGTPTGTYYSPMKFRWLTMVGGSKAQWCTQISGDYLFHSVPYRIADPTTLYTDLMYNYLGTTQSLGCIRLQAGDAKWIYDNCALGTEIYITPYESGGPIAKPGFSPIPSWHTWDPTDPTAHYLCEQHGCH